MRTSSSCTSGFCFEEDKTRGFIQIDASNAFSTINRILLLHNVKMLCPEFATYINNCYKKPSRLFTAGGKKISNKEPPKETQYQWGLMHWV